MKGHYPGRLYKLVDLEGNRYEDSDAVMEWDLTAACAISLFWWQLAEEPRKFFVVPADGSWGW